MSSHQNKNGKRKNHRGNRGSRRNHPDQNEVLLQQQLNEKNFVPSGRNPGRMESTKHSERR